MSRILSLRMIPGRASELKTEKAIVETLTSFCNLLSLILMPSRCAYSSYRRKSTVLSLRFSARTHYCKNSLVFVLPVNPSPCCGALESICQHHSTGNHTPDRILLFRIAVPHRRTTVCTFQVHQGWSRQTSSLMLKLWNLSGWT